jgi:predicted  nucleic acid-binding Zn-ribbon protein
MQKLDVMIARMRLLLADVAARESEANQAVRQFQLQTEKILSFTLYGEATLDSTLAMMSDVQERLDQSERTLRQLQLVRTRLEAELESLQLTRRIESLRSELTTLRARTNRLGTGEANSDATHVARRIQELQDEINAASERAARTIGARGSR